MSTTIITTASLEIAKDEELSIKSRPKRKPKPRFTMIGDGTLNTKNPLIPKSIDLLREIANMTANEKLCFFTIKDSIKYDRFDERMIYQTKPDMSKLTASQRSKFLLGFKLLNNRNIVRRISRGVYMISPMALVPDNFDREFSIWSNAGDEPDLQ